MGASSQTVKRKKKKLNGGEKSEECIKSFGDLPDVLIEKIFSFLPTKDAIRTSLLSKNWEYIWTSFPNLDFVYNMDDDIYAFLNAVERAFILRGAADIKQFKLLLQGHTSRVNLWVSALVRRNVEKLFLGLTGSTEPISLHSSLFTSATLKDLTLDVPGVLKVPSTVCFSSLRRLTLTSVEFSDDHSPQKLFLGCPVLEELTLSNCNWENLKFVTFCANKLLSLIIHEDQTDLQPSGGSCQIMIFGVTLNYFFYSGEFLNDYLFLNSSISKAEILNTTSRLRQTGYRLYNLFIGFSGMKILTTCSSSFEVVQTIASELLIQMPVFNNLATLIFEKEPVNIGCKGVLRMLQNCPCLQTVDFKEGIKLSLDDAKDERVLEPLPPCFLTSLKKIEVRAFHGNQDEFDALRILLKNALVVEKVIITCSDNLLVRRRKLRDVNRQVSGLPRGSDCCKVMVSSR